MNLLGQKSNVPVVLLNSPYCCHASLLSLSPMVKVDRCFLMTSLIFCSVRLSFREAPYLQNFLNDSRFDAGDLQYSSRRL